ncbi:hypothetical protein NKH57_29955 [Mesorhizobium sp. M1050]|uniref:thiolase family protein n=1 Tax=Mesorhizobium sp. M1050 TaxID=2957051 RepID=UPI00333D656B
MCFRARNGALKGDDVCFVGIGAPSAACNVARLTHAPDITLIYESGTIGTAPDVLPLSIGDVELCDTAVTTVSVPEMFRYCLQGGRITIGFLSAAQLDRFGNINTTVISDYAGLPKEVSGSTVNRLCGSGMDAVMIAARAIKAGEAELMIAGGVESISRAPFVMPKAETAFSRNAEIFDTTIGWRFLNPLMKKQCGVDSMPETGENVAEEFSVSRADQNAFAVRSQNKAVAAQENGRLGKEITEVSIAQRKGDAVFVGKDEHPRAGTTWKRSPSCRRLSGRAGRSPPATPGVNDGAAALIIAPEAAARKYGLTPIARILGGATAGVAPRIMAWDRRRRRKNSAPASVSRRTISTS